MLATRRPVSHAVMMKLFLCACWVRRQRLFLTLVVGLSRSLSCFSRNKRTEPKAQARPPQPRRRTRHRRHRRRRPPQQAEALGGRLQVSCWLTCHEQLIQMVSSIARHVAVVTGAQCALCTDKEEVSVSVSVTAADGSVTSVRSSAGVMTVRVVS